MTRRTFASAEMRRLRRVRDHGDWILITQRQLPSPARSLASLAPWAFMRLLSPSICTVCRCSPACLGYLTMSLSLLQRSISAEPVRQAEHDGDGIGRPPS